MLTIKLVHMFELQSATFTISISLFIVSDMCADAMGSRVNTREVRMRDQLLFERDTLIKVTFPLIEETKHASDINIPSSASLSVSIVFQHRGS